MKNKSIKTNAVLNIIKQCCSIILPLVTFPYISRILGTDNFGKYNFGSSIVSYFSLIAALGISNYAIREGARLRDKHDEFEKFANQVFSINIVTTIFSYIILVLILFICPKLFNYRELIIIQSIVIIFTTVGIDWINTIYEDYLYITLRYIVFQLISLVLLFLLIREKDDYIKYAFIIVFASAGANILNILYTKKYIKIRFTMKMNFKKHIIPMLILFCNSLAVTIYVNSDTTLLGLMKGDEIVGVYSIAVKIYMVVKQMLNALIIVTIPRLSLLLNNGDWDKYNKLLNKTIKVCLILIMPSIVGLFMLSKYIILIVGGNEYVNGYVALRILSVALGFAVLSCFFTNSILLPNRKEKYFLKATVIAGIVNLGVNFIMIPVLSLNGAALTTMLAELIVLGISIHHAKDDYKFENIIKTITQCCIGCIFIVVICIVVQHFFTKTLEITIISIVISTIVYGLTMIVLKNDIFIEIFNNIVVRVKKLVN